MDVKYYLNPGYFSIAFAMQRSSSKAILCICYFRIKFGARPYTLAVTSSYTITTTNDYWVLLFDEPDRLRIKIRWYESCLESENCLVRGYYQNKQRNEQRDPDWTRKKEADGHSTTCDHQSVYTQVCGKL